MPYNDFIKERAYEIWTSYRNIHEVAALMRDQYPEKCKTLSYETIRNWRDRMGWETRLETSLDQIRANTDKKVVGQALQFQYDLQDIYKKAIVKIKCGDVSFKSLESSIHALAKLQDMMLEYSGERSRLAKRFKTKKVAEVIFAVISKDELIQGRLARRGQDFMQEIEEEIDKMALEEQPRPDQEGRLPGVALQVSALQGRQSY